MELFRAGTWHDLIYEDEQSSKFWSIKIHKSTHIRHWGAIGTEGRETVTEFDNAELARKDAERLYKAKCKSGYRVRKPQLETKTELVHFVDWGDFERFVCKVYNKDEYSFVADIECGNDSSHRFNASAEMDDWERADLTRWVEGNGGSYMAATILNDCARQRLIPEGTYVIEVCW